MYTLKGEKDNGDWLSLTVNSGDKELNLLFIELCYRRLTGFKNFALIQGSDSFSLLIKYEDENLKVLKEFLDTLSKFVNFWNE